jgi:transcriptional regulator of arginine metabolism
MPPTDTEYRQNRQQEILRILHEGVQVASQEQFVELLRERGIPATQSSISRDLRDLGVYRYGGIYALPMTLKIDEATAQRDLDYRASLFLLRIQSAGPHLLVVVTQPGGAQSMAIAIENMKWGEVVGTIAGDDTIFIACSGGVELRRVFERLRKLLPER